MRRTHEPTLNRPRAKPEYKIYATSVTGFKEYVASVTGFSVGVQHARNGDAEVGAEDMHEY